MTPVTHNITDNRVLHDEKVVVFQSGGHVHVCPFSSVEYIRWAGDRSVVRTKSRRMKAKSLRILSLSNGQMGLLIKGINEVNEQLPKGWLRTEIPWQVLFALAATLFTLSYVFFTLHL